mmetsp:Transcript_19775/g.45544  ORF Transcript_19775/g.45544 Transcript_19775/m.45544 type:complete len:302 (-) Transcript_19775:797-1702(-)
MLFSMFCWHVEDNYMYSVSYLHEGAPKTWYGVSPKHAHDFDRVFADVAFSQALENDPMLFVKKSAMVPPTMLLEHGVPVCRATQQPGQFVVTLPHAYHGGFSHGFNAAEAVNFMLPDWLPYAQGAAKWYRRIGREPVLDLEQILVRAAVQMHSPEVMVMLQQVVNKEISQREQLRLRHISERRMSEPDKKFALGRGPPCFRCGHVCHLSFVQRGDDRSPKPLRPRHVACSEHFEELPSGDGLLFLFTRYDDDCLRLLTEAVVDEPFSTTLPPPCEPSPAAGATMARVLGILDERQHKRRRS